VRGASLCSGVGRAAATVAGPGPAVANPANALSDRCTRNGEPTVPVAAIKWFGEALETAVKRPVEASGYACELRARVGSAPRTRDRRMTWIRSFCIWGAPPTSHQTRTHRISNLFDPYQYRSTMLEEYGNRALALEDARRTMKIGREAVEAAEASDARFLPVLVQEALRGVIDSADGSHLAPSTMGTVVGRGSAGKHLRTSKAASDFTLRVYG